MLGSREERLIDTAAPQAIHDRLLALITPTPQSQRVVRRAWRSAQRRLASVLGAHLLIEHGDDIAATAARVAQDRGTTYILMGRPKPRSAIRRLLQPALPFRLLSLLPGVDLRIVADRTLRAAGGNGVPPTDGDAAAAGTADEKRDEGVIDAEYVDVEDKH